MILRNDTHLDQLTDKLREPRMRAIVDSEQNSLLFDVPANFSLTLTCTDWAEPMQYPRFSAVQMRQSMNFSLLQSPALSQAGVLLSGPFRNGFED